jgi:hypothetical protein
MKARARARSIALLFFAFAAAPSLRAQIDLGGPQGGSYGTSKRDKEEEEQQRKKREELMRKQSVAPFAAALYEAFSPADWLMIKISTASPKEEITKQLQNGVYRQELVMLVLAAKKSGQPLKKLLDKREGGDTLRSIAEGLKLDYAALFDEASDLKDKLDARAAAIEVESTTGTAVSPSVSTAPISRSDTLAPSASTGTAVSTGTKAGPP